MPDIEIQPFYRADEAVLQSLLQLYVHDFSEHWADTDKGDLNALGRFADYPLEPYWTDTGHVAVRFRVAGQLAGFALLNDHGHAGRPVDTNVAEFFVVRKYRRGGIGTTFARTLFSSRPGIWEAAIARKNVAALGFWRNAIAGCAEANDVEEVDIASPEWNGPILRFVIR